MIRGLVTGALNVAGDILAATNENQNIVSRATGVVGDMALTQRIDALKRGVGTKMDQFENASKFELDSTICGLYLHFLLSVFAIFECFIHIIVDLFLILTWGIIYLIFACATCGKVEEVTALGTFNFVVSRYFFYFGILCSLLGNICYPCKPPLYFWKSVTMLRRPDGVRSNVDYGIISNSNVTHCFCCRCCDRSEGSLTQSGLPIWKLMHVLFFSVGGFYCLNNWCTFEKNWAASIRQEMNAVMDAETETFYRREFGCSSIDEYLARECYSYSSSSSTGSRGSGNNPSQTAAFITSQPPYYPPNVHPNANTNAKDNNNNNNNQQGNNYAYASVQVAGSAPPARVIPVVMATPVLR